MICFYFIFIYLPDVCFLLFRNKSLTSISLVNCGIVESMELFTMCRNNRYINNLDLSNNNISDRGAHVLPTHTTYVQNLISKCYIYSY